MKTFNKNTRFEILTPNGFQEFDGTLQSKKDSLRLIFSDSTDLICTHDHKLLVDFNIKLARNIQLGDIISDKLVVDIIENGEILVYDPVNVSNGHLYISNGVISHNCEFIGASNTLISGSKLKLIPVETPIATSSTMRIYEEPHQTHQYVITVDLARGTGGDYSAFVVFDVSVLPYKVVAIYADNTISPMLYPGLIMNIAIKYNNAVVLIETNDIGEAVALSLYHDLEYEETMMSTDSILSSFGGRVPGIKTTKRTKAIGCLNLKTLIENDQLVINDYDLLYELLNFVAKGTSYEADNGHDDLVMCLVLFAYLTTQSAMADLLSQLAKDKIIAMRQRIEEDNMLPIGFFSDGTETELQVCNF